MIKYFINIAAGAISLIKGLFVTFKNLFSKAVTVQYPTQKLQMTERYRGLVDLRIEKCIKCYMCVKICPTACLSLSHKETAEKKKAGPSRGSSGSRLAQLGQMTLSTSVQ